MGAVTHVFHFDDHPRVHLITEAMPGPRWNGFEAPCPTPKELVRFLDQLRKEITDDGEWWGFLEPLVAYYGSAEAGWDEPITGVNGWVWQATPMFHVADSPMNKAQGQGHLNRTGHPLVAYYTPTDDEQTIFTMVRLCCPENPDMSGKEEGNGEA